jgi:hypothetical protein
LRRLSAILFLAVLLFNLYGYRVMLSYLQARESVVFQSQLDKEQYSEDDLITIKTPLNLPYYSSSTDFERAYGSVEVNGMVYEYVKRRVSHDTLELLCIPNKTKAHLQSTQSAFVKLSVDGSSFPNEKKSVNTFKITLPDYCQQSSEYSFASSMLIHQHYYSSNTIMIQEDHSWIQGQPPRVIA